jgi:hypothetical protein
MNRKQKPSRSQLRPLQPGRTGDDAQHPGQLGNNPNPEEGPTVDGDLIAKCRRCGFSAVVSARRKCKYSQEQFLTKCLYIRKPQPQGFHALAQNCPYFAAVADRILRE